ncbi:Cobalt-precorrin-7 (C5)-methyltransferase [Candidatus Syntrophocurvum alkaliphilum]|uniref:Cobalt-precorrin-7 (C5)-methyltransferase n=1 Tax=Candidatus Syntrophocurvum alkaliphilum TaxID=2293317 RepID=A0A6I6DHJ6_9FIRM|nr:precorrin-6y C5,15-methyltransferase (decarboxylating) subunit CbiE [Candidatus Syntrophocurvum alkaliphilum]QGU00253.1 Cobalt-precorrin-7 (C5)-methyltransferase [Candidatus Syntrophocurvum alkaliphilum]
MSNKVTIVGTGPGDIRYITPMALEKIKNADVLVGPKRLLDELATPQQIQIFLNKNLKEITENIYKYQNNKKVVVMVSGDTGLFSYANYLSSYIEAKYLEIIPGISSVQLMFARLKRSWENAQMISVHGRNDENLVQKIKSNPISAVLTGNPWTVTEISKHLLKHGVPNLDVAVGKDLSYPEEQIIYSNLEELTKDRADYNNSVMVIFNE